MPPHTSAVLPRGYDPRFALKPVYVEGLRGERGLNKPFAKAPSFAFKKQSVSGWQTFADQKTPVARRTSVWAKHNIKRQPVSLLI